MGGEHDLIFKSLLSSATACYHHIIMFGSEIHTKTETKQAMIELGNIQVKY